MNMFDPIFCFLSNLNCQQQLVTVNCNIEQINVHKKLMLVCLKLIFRRLLITFNTKCTFKFNNRFLKQVDGCTIGRLLSVTFNEIYLIKMKKKIN